MPTATGMMYLKQDSLPLMWCSGCGNGIVLGSMLRAFEELGYRHNEIVVVTGIGCWGRLTITWPRTPCIRRMGAPWLLPPASRQSGRHCTWWF